MRGALGIARSIPMYGGIIPAYAGSTRRLQSAGPQPWDHPRVCGEHKEFSYAGEESDGSSPRMRGALGGQMIRVGDAGIIPAYAGSTDYVWRGDVLFQDHPRVCGEHRGESEPVQRIEGSSPRMRGALSEGMKKCHITRIIPAYAGSTECENQETDSSEDHPRVCGEH